MTFIAIGQILIVVNGKILNKKYSHLVTPDSESNFLSQTTTIYFWHNFHQNNFVGTMESFTATSLWNGSIKRFSRWSYFQHFQCDNNNNSSNCCGRWMLWPADLWCQNWRLGMLPPVPSNGSVKLLLAIFIILSSFSHIPTYNTVHRFRISIFYYLHRQFFTRRRSAT